MQHSYWKYYFFMYLLFTVYCEQFDNDKAEIAKMNNAGFVLTNRVVKMLVMGCRADIEKLANEELDIITLAIDNIENQHLKSLKKLSCRAENIGNRRDSAFNCVKNYESTIDKEIISSKIKACTLRESFLKQVLAYAATAVDEHDKIQRNDELVFRMLRMCYKKSIDLEPVLMCIEDHPNDAEDRNKAKNVYKHNLLPMYKAGQNLVYKANEAILKFSEANHKKIEKLIHGINNCQKDQ